MIKQKRQVSLRHSTLFLGEKKGKDETTKQIIVKTNIVTTLSISFFNDTAGKGLGQGGKRAEKITVTFLFFLLVVFLAYSIVLPREALKTKPHHL